MQEYARFATHTLVHTRALCSTVNDSLASKRTCFGWKSMCHYNDVIMSAMASQITSLAIVYSTVYSGADQRKYHSSSSLAFVRGIHRWPVNSQRASNTENISNWWRQQLLYHAGESLRFLASDWLRNGSGCEAAFLVGRQRFPYRSRFNFSVKNMENMLLCNAIFDIMHIDFSWKIYCGANDASIGF